MSEASEEQLLSVVNRGITEASSYNPLYKSQESLEIFRECKAALDSLAAMDSEKGFARMEYICTVCIRDGFFYSGLRDHAKGLLKHSKNLTARLYYSILENDIDEVCFLATQSQTLKAKIENLAAKREDLDVWESPAALWASTKLAGKVLRILEDEKELEAVLKRRVTRLCKQAEEQKRREEEGRRRAVEEWRTRVQSKRKSLAQCVMCGQRLNFFQRLLGRDRHNACKTFKE